MQFCGRLPLYSRVLFTEGFASFGVLFVCFRIFWSWLDAILRHPIRSVALRIFRLSLEDFAWQVRPLDGTEEKASGRLPLRVFGAAGHSCPFHGQLDRKGGDKLSHVRHKYQHMLSMARASNLRNQLVCLLLVSCENPQPKEPLSLKHTPRKGHEQEMLPFWRVLRLLDHRLDARFGGGFILVSL